jgi:DNA-binding protein YbaB
MTVSNVNEKIRLAQVALESAKHTTLDRNGLVHLTIAQEELVKALDILNDLIRNRSEVAK